MGLSRDIWRRAAVEFASGRWVGLRMLRDERCGVATAVCEVFNPERRGVLSAREARGQARQDIGERLFWPLGRMDVGMLWLERRQWTAGSWSRTSARSGRCAAFKRMKNILAQAAEKGIAAGSNVNDAGTVNRALRKKALAERSGELAGRVKALGAEKNYKAALEQMLQTLRPQVDAFFDGSDGDGSGCCGEGNRLALLEECWRDFSGIAGLCWRLSWLGRVHAQGLKACFPALLAAYTSAQGYGHWAAEKQRESRASNC